MSAFDALRKKVLAAVDARLATAITLAPMVGGPGGRYQPDGTRTAFDVAGQHDEQPLDQTVVRSGGSQVPAGTLKGSRVSLCVDIGLLVWRPRVGDRVIHPSGDVFRIADDPVETGDGRLRLILNRLLPNQMG